MIAVGKTYRACVAPARFKVVIDSSHKIKWVKRAAVNYTCCLHDPLLAAVSVDGAVELRGPVEVELVVDTLNEARDSVDAIDELVVDLVAPEHDLAFVELVPRGDLGPLISPVKMR